MRNCNICNMLALGTSFSAWTQAAPTCPSALFPPPSSNPFYLQPKARIASKKFRALATTAGGAGAVQFAVHALALLIASIDSSMTLGPSAHGQRPFAITRSSRFVPPHPLTSPLAIPLCYSAARAQNPTCTYMQRKYSHNLIPREKPRIAS